MLIVLPPSETKATGGTGAPLQLEELSFPTLTQVRAELLDDLLALSELPEDDQLTILGISANLAPELRHNAALLSAPTMPAIERFTGVLFDALGAADLKPAQRSRLAVGDALFGLLGAEDPIPHYRLSGGTKLPYAGEVPASAPTMKRRWGKAITSALEDVDQAIIDLRSGTYQQLGRVPRALTVRVETEHPETGARKVVSHFNKHYKGQLARALAQTSADLSTTATRADLIELAQQLGFTAEPAAKDNEITLVVSR